MAVHNLKNFFHITGNILFTIFIIAMMLLVGFMVKGKLDGGEPSVGPYTFYVVLSGSMSPEFDTGSILVVKDVTAREVAQGDIITFKSPEDASKTITHRVVEITEENGQLAYITRGDANNANDTEPVPAANLLGEAVYWVPYAGYVTDFMGTKKGLFCLIIIPGVLVIAGEIRNLMRYAAEYEQEKAAAEEGNPSTRA